MSYSEVQICNLALERIGGRRITSLIDNSEDARACNSLFASLRDEIISSAQWPFAMKRAALSRLTDTPAFGFDYTYQLPSDMLRLIMLVADDGETQITEFEIEGKTVLTDEETVYIKYIKRETDQTKFTAGFVKALSAKLAAELAGILAKSNGLRSELNQTALVDLNIGLSMDLGQVVDYIHEATDLLDARN